MGRLETFVEDGQNLFDLVVQCEGSLDFALTFAKENNLNLNTNLNAGQRLTFERLAQESREYPANKATQDFFLNRKLRVRTGECKYIPKPFCPIPEGYVLLQFAIESIGKKHCFFLDLLGRGCPIGSYFEGLRDYQAHIFCPISTHNMQALAMYFTNWINSRSIWAAQGVYAVSTANVVSIYIPGSLVSCGKPVGICTYELKKRKEGKPPSFELAAEPASFQFNIPIDGNKSSGLTECCGRRSSVGSLGNYSSWQLQSIF